MTDGNRTKDQGLDGGPIPVAEWPVVLPYRMSSAAWPAWRGIRWFVPYAARVGDPHEF